jgi:hypothetical protein
MRYQRRLVGAVAAAGVLAVVATAPGLAAGPSVSVQMTLTEPLKAGWPGAEPCPDIGIDVNCGSGEVVPFGHATHIVSIGACGETCNLRRIDLPQGSIFLVETVSDFSCPGACVPEFPPPTPFALSLSAVVVGGLGSFSGATGTLIGSVKGAGWHAQIKLAGTITLAAD